MSTFEFTIDNCILINKQQIKFYTRHLSDRKNSKEIAGEKKVHSPGHQLLGTVKKCHSYHQT